MENIMDKTELEEKYEITLNKMYFTLHKIIKVLEEEKETHENNLSISYQIHHNFKLEQLS